MFFQKSLKKILVLWGFSNCSLKISEPAGPLKIVSKQPTRMPGNSKVLHKPWMTLQKIQFLKSTNLQDLSKDIQACKTLQKISHSFLYLPYFQNFNQNILRAFLKRFFKKLRAHRSFANILKTLRSNRTFQNLFKKKLLPGELSKNVL